MALDIKVQPKRFFHKREIKEYIIDETVIKAGSKFIWLWIVIEPVHKEILSFYISKKRNISVAKRFLSTVINKYGTHVVSTDGGTLVSPGMPISKTKTSPSLFF